MTTQTDACQICGKPVHNPYYWNDDHRLPMHKNMWLCQSADPLLFVAFINRNVEYLNGRGDPVMLENGGRMIAGNLHVGDSFRISRVSLDVQEVTAVRVLTIRYRNASQSDLTRESTLYKDVTVYDV